MKIHASLEKYLNQETKEFECLYCHNKFLLNYKNWSDCKKCFSFAVLYHQRIDELVALNFNLYVDDEKYKIYQFYDDPIEFSVSRAGMRDIICENIIVEDFNDIEERLLSYILFT